MNDLHCLSKRSFAQVQHPNCISLYAVYITPRKVYLVTELVTGGELLDRYLNGSHSTVCLGFGFLQLSLPQLWTFCSISLNPSIAFDIFTSIFQQQQSKSACCCASQSQMHSMSCISPQVAHLCIALCLPSLCTSMC